MNSDTGGKSALGEGLGLEPAAWAVTAHGRVQKFVVRADVADEAVCGWRASDPEAAAVPLYTWATVNATAAAEREKWVPYVQHGKAGGQMCDRMKHSDYVCTCGLDELRARA